MAQINLINYQDLGANVTAAVFAYRGDIKWSSVGPVKFWNPVEAHFEFITNKGQAYTLVNGGFTAEYTLFQDRLTEPGLFAKGFISGTNRDYGSRCTIDNAKLWDPDT